jgi:hypothetical protein
MIESYATMDDTDGGGTAWPQVPTQRQLARYWSAFVVTIALLFMLTAWWIHSPGQDHIASIPLNGDGTWFHNYEIGFEIQDNDIFFHSIGHSIQNAQQADIIILGSSRALFGFDWQLFEDFERKHHLKMFNMAFAGVTNGEFALRIIRKWGLHPKMWIIDLFAGPIPEDIHTSFFFTSLKSAPKLGISTAARVVGYTRVRAFKNVLGRDIRWRLKTAAGLLKQDPYRSATTGSWYLDNWPNHKLDSNPRIKMTVGERCRAPPEELAGAGVYVAAIGGAVVLTQVPSTFSCDQRVLELASALAVPAFTVDATQFSTTDGGGHLDDISAHKYTTMFFGWLEQLPAFERLFSR